jgi:hypothetical protein
MIVSMAPSSFIVRITALNRSRSGLPAGTTIVPGSSTIHQGGTMLPGGAGAPILPSGPGGAPGPVPSAGIPTPVSAVSTSRPVVISDEVVLP